ncbi:MAG: polysaccharide deacetylase family protein [Solirubrobacteraceae bacterium]
MPAEDPRSSRDRSEAARRRGLRRRQVRRRRAAALAVVAAVVLLCVLALNASGGERLTGSGRAAERKPLVPAAVADLRVRRLARIGKPVYCGGRHRPYVALTFDDGPGPSTAAAVRELLARRVPATFFLVGQNVARYRSVLPLEARAGAIGDHTFHHVQLTALALVDAGREIDDAARAITTVTHSPVRLMRPPSGARTPPIDAVVRAEGMLQVLWDVDVQDIEGAGTAAVVDAVRRHARPGSIVLMHENEGQTLAALPQVLDALARKHLRPVTVPELMAADPPSPAQLEAGPTGCGLHPSEPGA